MDGKQDGAESTPSAPSIPRRPGTFVKGDPRIKAGRPLGVINKKNRPALALLEAAQEEVAKRVLELTKPVRADAEPCPLCGRGFPRDEKLVLQASAEVLDRGGTPRKTQVESIDKPDMEWVEYLTAEESLAVYGYIEAARSRMPINDGQADQSEEAATPS